MQNAGHKIIPEIMLVIFELKYVHIKRVIYVTMGFVVTVQYKGKENSDFCHDILLLR